MSTRRSGTARFPDSSERRRSHPASQGQALVFFVAVAGLEVGQHHVANVGVDREMIELEEDALAIADLPHGGVEIGGEGDGVEVGIFQKLGGKLLGAIELVEVIVEIGQQEFFLTGLGLTRLREAGRPYRYRLPRPAGSRHGGTVRDRTFSCS